MGDRKYRDIQEHAFARDMAWLQAHPGQEPDYYDGTRDMIDEALDEWADSYNYILRSHLPGEAKHHYLLEIHELYAALSFGRPKRE